MIGACWAGVEIGSRPIDGPQANHASHRDHMTDFTPAVFTSNQASVDSIC